MVDNVINLEARRKVVAEAEGDDVVCVITVRENAQVRTWVSDRIETDTQWDWLHSKIAAATSQLVAMGNEDDGGRV